MATPSSASGWWTRFREAGADAPAPKVYNLVADGDLAKQVTALIGKNVDITGSGEPASYKLESIVEHVKKPKKTN